MALDSKAYFNSLATAYGLGPYLERMDELGWSTMGVFAFCASFVPGSPDDTPFIVKVVIPVLGTEEHRLTAALRRLHFDAYTLIAADAQRRGAGMEEDAKPRRLPAPEQNSRLDELKIQLNPGVQIQRPLEPSHLLIDKYTAMVETGELRWLPWAELTSREAEFRGSKTEDVLTPEGSMRTWPSFKDFRTCPKGIYR